MGANGAMVVDMEAAGVAERAHGMGVPFVGVKAVTDLAGETLENDFQRVLRPDGHFDTIGILESGLRKPADADTRTGPPGVAVRARLTCLGSIFCRLPILSRRRYRKSCTPRFIAGRAW